MTVGSAVRMLTALGIAVLVLGAHGSVEAASASNARGAERPEKHCVLEVVGEDQGGAFVMAPERCFASRSDASRYAGSTNRDGGSMTQSAAATIGVHFTGLSYTGSSITISGTTCSGGRWYPTGSWNDQIQSSYHYCGSRPTTFYEYSNCVGSTRSIFSHASTLGAMNRQTSCVQYG